MSVENEKPSMVIEGETEEKIKEDKEPVEVRVEEKQEEKEEVKKDEKEEVKKEEKEEEEEKKKEEEEEKTPAEEIDGKSRENGGEKHEAKPGKENGKRKTADEEDGGGLRSGGFEIVAIKEKHGQMRKAVPIMPLPLAIVLCLVNVILPGIGTLVSAFVVFCGGKTEYESKGKAFGLNVIAAILQLVTLPIIVGWIWSIVWGVTFITSAMSKEESTKDGTQVPPPEHV